VKLPVGIEALDSTVFSIRHIKHVSLLVQGKAVRNIERIWWWICEERGKNSKKDPLRRIGN
jgi:hypothetical protein